VLIVCISQGYRCDDPKAPKGTLRTLEGKGLVHVLISRKKREVWRATDAGRRLIARSGLTPEFLHRHSQYGYTHSLAQAMAREPEVMRP
jgi:hypothetical protein